MAYLDTLEILITADRSGLESQLKRGIESVDRFINNVGKDGIDWKQIFTKGFTPSVVAGVASTMAMALSQIIKFQNESAKSAQMSGEQTGGALDAIGDQALEISEKTGVSLELVNEALTEARKHWTDMAMQTLIATDAALQAEAGLGSAAGNAKTFSEILAKFGITDVPTASRSLDILTRAASASKIGYEEFLNTVNETASGFDKAGISLDELTTGLYTFGQRADVTGSMAVKTFKTMAEAIEKSDHGLNLAFGGLDRIQSFLRTGGIPLALEKIRQKFQDGGIVAQKLGELAGFTGTEIVQMGKVGVIAIDKMTEAMRKFGMETKSVQQRLYETESFWGKLEKASVSFWASFLKQIQEMKKVDFGKELKDVLTKPQTYLEEAKAGLEMDKKWYQAPLRWALGSKPEDVDKFLSGDKKTGTKSPSPTTGSTPPGGMMGATPSFNFTNTFILGGGTSREFAESIAKQLQTLMHTQ